MAGQDVMVKLGDRRNSGFCLKCGSDLIVVNDYQCCSECTKFIEQCLAKLAHKNKVKKGKVGGMRVIDKRLVLRQVVPIGTSVK